MLSLLTILMSTKREGTSVSDYMTKIKSIVNNLALISHPLSNVEIIAHTLNGLGNEFKELKVSIRVRESLITFEISITNC